MRYSVSRKKNMKSLHDISFTVHRNETVCIVGESGCGKSVTTLCVMGLLPKNGRVTEGSIQLDGNELTHLNDDQIRKYRGSKMGMIFQEPMTALNPLLTIGYQLRENLMLHRGVDKKTAEQMAIEYLNKVGIANAPSRMKQYPFQLSGGLRQRILIAMVLSAQPDLLIADEPTTALDVTIQKQVLTLLNGLKKDMNAGILFITHDLGVVAEIADRVIVLYAGRKVEEGSTEQIFTHPAHPYTIGLMNAVPDVDKDGDDMEPIPGMFPNITEVIPGCRFNPRCPHAAECSLCKQEVPSLTEIEPGHYAACHLVKKEVQP